MAIQRLLLTDFRNHAKATITPGPQFVILTGENGAGKTNILEAVSLLVPGRGLRGASLSAIARQNGGGGFGVAAHLWLGDGDTEIGTGTLASAPDRRIVRINGANAPINALSEWLSTVWLTPAMDRLFSDGGSERRRFLDRLVLALDPAHASRSTRYEAAMRQRNRLLGEDQPVDTQWLDALEAQMAEHGRAIAQARASLIEALNETIAAAPVGAFARATLALAGWDAADSFARDLTQGRARDAAAGRTLAGPHRTDLLVQHAAKNQPAMLCSTGEQKALLLTIILGHAALVAERLNRPPILLFDEVAAHLDPLRRRVLFDQLSSTGCQVWMTGTEPALFSEIGVSASRFHVAEGNISAA